MRNIVLFLLFFCAYPVFVLGKLKTRPESQTVMLGQSVMLNCSLFPSKISKRTQYQWTHNDGMLGNHEPGILPGHDQRYHYVSENPDELNLLIHDVRTDDAGKFECQMFREGMKKPARASANLSVLVPPSEIQLVMANASANFSEPNSAITVNSGDSVNIPCFVNAKPNVPTEESKEEKIKAGDTAVANWFGLAIIPIYIWVILSFCVIVILVLCIVLVFMCCRQYDVIYVTEREQIRNTFDGDVNVYGVDAPKQTGLQIRTSSSGQSEDLPSAGLIRTETALQMVAITMPSESLTDESIYET